MTILIINVPFSLFADASLNAGSLQSDATSTIPIPHSHTNTMSLQAAATPVMDSLPIAATATAATATADPWPGDLSNGSISSQASQDPDGSNDSLSFQASQDGTVDDSDESFGLPSDEEEEPELFDMEDGDLPPFEEVYDPDAMQNDQELLFDPFDRREEEEEPELLFMENDDEMSSEEEAEESDSINDNNQELRIYYDRKDMDEDFRRSPLFDWLVGRLSPIPEEDQFELDEIEAEQWVSDHPDVDPWQPIGYSIPIPNAHQEVPMVATIVDAPLTDSSKKIPRRFSNSSRKFLARIGRGLLRCCCIPCRKD